MVDGIMEERRLKRLLKKIWIMILSEWKTFAVSFLACAFYAVGVAAFTIPYKFTDLGVMGIAVLLKYAMGLNAAVVALVINMALILWGSRYLSKRFVFWSVLNSFLLSAMIDFFGGFPYPRIDDMFLVSVIGGVIKGLGTGLFYREGVTAGGIDVIVTVLKARRGVEAGRLSFYFNMAILAVSLSVVVLENVLYGLASCYVCGVTLDGVLASFDRRKLVFVVTQHTEAVNEYINKTLGRGCTLLSCEGGFTHKGGFTIMCLLTQRQAMELKRFLAKHYQGSFMAVSAADEVLGRGFKRWRSI